MASITEGSGVPEKQRKRFFTPHLYFILWCGCIISQSMLVSGFLNVVISSIQVEYQLTSAEVAMFPSDYDITVAVTVLVVSHFGKSHKPRTLGIGMLVLSLGSFIFALPNFIFKSKQEAKLEDLYLCSKNSVLLTNITADCRSESAGNSHAYVLLTLGSILIGVGASPVYTAGTTFCDEIFSPNKVSLYFGISYAIGAVSPALGFILGGLFLGYYKTLGKPPNGMDYENQNWVGAWWLGFLICASMALVVGLILLLFPAQLPECEIVRKKKLELNIQVLGKNCEDPVATSGDEKKLTFIELTKEILPLLKSILSNPVYVIMVIGSVFDSLIGNAFAAFLPKMIQSQFKLSSSMAAFLTGAVIVPGVAGGIFMSGIIVRWRKLTGLQCAKWQSYIGLICLFLMLGFMFHCPTSPINGVNYEGSCSADQCLNCPGTQVYSPVCIDGVTYTSPCDAACTGYNETSLEYLGCCGQPDGVPSGVCKPDECNAMIPFIVFLFFIMFFLFLNNIIFLNINLRCVKDNERVMAISLQSCMFRILGSFPGPIILGSLLDKTCILWNTDECDQKGACQEYDNKQVMVAAVTVAMISKFIGTLLYFVGWKVWESKDRTTVTIAYTDSIKNHDNEDGQVVVVNRNRNGTESAENMNGMNHTGKNHVGGMHEIYL